MVLFLAAIQLSSCQSESKLSLESLTRDGYNSQLRQVPPSAERGPPPGSQFVAIPVVPLPSGATHRPHPSQPPQPPPTSSTPPPQPPEVLVITGQLNLPVPPRTRPKRPRPVPFWTTSTQRPRVKVPLLYSEDLRHEDGSYTFA